MKPEKGKWAFRFISIVLIGAIFMSAVVYIIDPLYKYRISDTKYILSEQYSSPGLVRFYEYDTLLIGSSMVQNTDMEHFNNKLNVNAIKIGIGGMGLLEQGKYISLANEKKDVKKYYICVDLASINKPIRTNSYLFEDDAFSQIKYFFNYEVWTRYIPVDVGLIMADLFGIDIPKSAEKATDVKRMGEWKDGAVFGKEQIIHNYINKKFAVSEVDKTDLVETSKKNIDVFFEEVDISKAEYNFFFPPYSALAWYDFQQDECFEEFLEIKEYFVEKATSSRANVYDFQSDEMVLNLDNYKDTTHYSPKINNWMTECFYAKEKIVTNENIGKSHEKLRDIVETFEKENPQLVKSE